MNQHFQWLDPERLRYVVGSVMGVAIYGVYSLVQTFKAGQRPTLNDLTAAGVNLACAAVTGVLAAYALGPVVVALIPFEALREAADPLSVGLPIGVVFWELLPFLIDSARKRARKIGGE